MSVVPGFMHVLCHAWKMYMDFQKASNVRPSWQPGFSCKDLQHFRRLLPYFLHQPWLWHEERDLCMCSSHAYRSWNILNFYAIWYAHVAWQITKFLLNSFYCKIETRCCLAFFYSRGKTDRRAAQWIFNRCCHHSQMALCILNLPSKEEFSDYQLNTPGQICVCSRHFQSGKPSALFDHLNCDWMPTLQLGYDNTGKKV